MLLYITLFFLLFILTYLEILSNNKQFSQNSIIIVTTFFFILSFIRWDTGTDWEPYFEAFERIKIPWENLSDKYSEFEWGFMVLYNIAKSLSDSYTMMLFIEATILYMCMFHVIKTHSLYPIFSLFIYYCMSFAGIFFVRQNIAMIILLCSLKYIYERKIIPFIIIVCIASLIHRTAIIFLLSYPIYKYYYSLKFIIVSVLITTLLGLFLTKLMLNMIGGLGLGIISAKINAYLDLGENDNSTTFSTTGILIRGLINRAFLVILYLSILNKDRAQNRVLNGLINLNIFGIILYIILTPIAFSLGRVTAYFDILQIFILPYLFTKCTFRAKYTIISLLSIYLFFRLYTAIAAFPQEYIPYKTFIEYY